jgi:hypothetical protein
LKSIFVILIILLFLVSPIHAQLLSDTTGLINRLEIQTSGHIFEIKLTSNFDIDNFIFNKDQKELTLYLESNLENNLSEIIIPKNLLSGDFTFFLNDQEIFPKVQSNEIISFITLEFSGSGTHIVKIIGTEYLSGLSEMVPIENEIPILTEISTNEIPSNDYAIWFIVGGILVTIVVLVGIKILKNKN